MYKAVKSLAFALPVVLLAALTGCGGGGPLGVMITSGSTQSLDAGQSTNLSATVTNDSGNAGVNWTVTGGGTLSNSTTSNVTYTAPSTVTSQTTVTVTATSVKDGSKTGTVTITVYPAPTITISSVASGTVGTAYSANLTASGGVAPLMWSVSSGSLPAGLTLSTNGVISGTPTAPGSSTFTVKVSDSAPTPVSATQQLSISIVPAPLVITTTSATLGNAVAGSAYTGSLVSSGGTGSVTWSATGLPSGLSISSTGVISGTAAASGVFPVTVTASDSGAGAYQQTKTTTINLTVIPVLTVAAPAAQTAITNTAFSLQMQATGGVTAYTWSATGLPAGLSIGASTGLISGSATAAGTSSATITVSDSGTPKQTKSVTVSFTVVTQLTVTTTSLPNVVAGTAYSTSLATAGGTGGVTWSISGGALPAGLSLNGSGAITGTTTSAGAYSVTVQALDSGTGAAQQTATKTLSLTVIPQLLITTTSLHQGTANTAYSQTVSATGGVTNYTWTATGLPQGLSIDAGTGIISGTTGLVGNFNVTITVKDSGNPQQTATANLTLTTVPAPLTITTSSLPGGEVSLTYVATLTSSGGTGGITWSITGGALPAGLGLNSSNGEISGTPTTAGTTSVTVMASDTGSPQQTKSATLSIQVYPQLVITTTSLPSGTVGTAYSTQLQSTGGSNTITWSVSAGQLPPGLTMASNGTISGTPTSSGNFTFTAQASDAFGPVTKQFTISVSGGPLSITTAALTGGTVNIPYNATLQATGGTQPYTWSLTSGTLPGGLSLNANTGAITGTPTAAANSVALTFKVTDSSGTPLTMTQNYTLTIVQSGVNNSELKGNYVFLFNGFANGNATGKVYGEAIVGVLTADGNGNITSGLVDVNTAGGVTTQVPVAGVYSIGADNRGTIVVTSASSSTTFAVALSSISSGVAGKMQVIEFDDTSSTGANGIGSGFAKLQGTSVPTALSGNYVFGLQGESPCNTCASPATPYGPVTAAGIFTVSGGTVSAGQEDAGAVGTSYTGITLGGSAATSSGSAGRGTLTLTPSGTLYPAAPSHFVYYVISANELVMMSIDSHASYTLLSGDVQLQQQASFSSSSLTGTMVGSELQAASNGDGLSVYPSGTSAQLLMITVPTSGTVSVSHDQNKNGAITSGPLGTFTYTVASNGRVSLGSGAPIFYLYNTGAAIGVEQSTGGSPGLITFEPQAAITFDANTLSGNFAIGTNASPTPINMNSGVVNLASGSGTITTDSSDPSGTLTSGQTQAFTYTVDSKGRVVVTSGGSTNVVLYIISAQKALVINVKNGDTSPSIQVIEHQ